MSDSLCLKEKVQQLIGSFEDSYLYSAARFRTRSFHLLTADELGKIAESGRAEELIRQLSERGIEISRGDDGHPMVEEALERFLNAALNEVERTVPDPEWVALFRYPYDAHNIKTVLKCRVMQNPKNAAPLLVNLGTVSAESVENAIQTESYGNFPAAMAQAIPHAIETYAQTADPQLIDAIIDAACYRDLLTLADRYPQAVFRKAIGVKIDMTNLITAIRIRRMSRMTADYFGRHYISGGALSQELFFEQFEKGEDALLSAASQNGYPVLEKAVGAGLRLSELERRCESVTAGVIRWTAGEPMDSKLIYAYLSDLEKEVKNIRILLTAMQAGYSSSGIRELLRV